MQTDTPPRPANPDETYYSGSPARRWGILLLVVGVIWLVFELTSRGSIFGVGLGFMERSADAPPQSFAAARLVVRGANDTISLERAPGDSVTVAAVRHGFGWNAGAARAALDRLDVQITQSGDTLTVEVRRAAGLPSFIGRSPYVDLRIGVPDGLALDVQTASGEIVADGLRASGSLATVSGDIALSDSSGHLSVSSTSGDVHMSGAFSGPQVETVSGDIWLEGASGPLRAHTISGDISLRGLREAQLDLETTSGDVDATGALAGTISTISGDVQLRLPSASDLALNVSTVSGDLSSDLELRDTQQDRRRLSGTLGAGEGALTISTTSGDVEVDGE
ncbi:DUF4097 domain-containing protein [Oscillochloris sp. ZM17-4]|uniref:DUF4097 family beta strand repeat-containing protein n=1 Tax=Oscillochloris sp. ZM17-4 TaxID=2866714 RepID=UPI001C729FD6|nr:DUF4097 family beta strand repeat-containing protein [Oscillochloris sp. ZM17-4]MBX0327216.1 DUF4097 domain-containing protein [Oscillochloris sp. ZM17-4]